MEEFVSCPYCSLRFWHFFSTKELNKIVYLGCAYCHKCFPYVVIKEVSVYDN